MAFRFVFLLQLIAFAAGIAAASKTCREKSPPPIGFICRQTGSVSNANTFAGPSIVNSFNACRNLAFENPQLKSFGWDSSNQQCHFYTAALSQNGFKSSTTSTITFSDENCTICAATCPAPLGVNQIPNPGFQASKRFIGPWRQISNSNGMLKVVSPGSNSTNALSVTLDGSLGQYLNYLCDGTEYIFGFDYKYSRAGSASTGTAFNFVDSSYGIENSKQSNTVWTRYEDYVPQRAGSINNVPAQFDLYDFDDSGLDWLLDNFGLYQVGPAVVKTGATERIRNGGFEDKTLSPWYTDSPSSDLALASTGLDGSRQALNVTANSQYQVISQNVTLTPGAHYLFTLEYSYPRTTVPKNSFSVSLRLDGGLVNSLEGAVDSYYGFEYTSQKGQRTYSRRVVAHGAETKIQLSFDYNIFNPKFYQPVLIDNVSLKEVEKPQKA